MTTAPSGSGRSGSAGRGGNPEAERRPGPGLPPSESARAAGGPGASVAGSREEGTTVPKGLCLVTGATGFVGSHLTEALVDAGYRVRALVRRTSRLDWIRGLPLELAYGDVRDKASLSGACVGVVNVFHFGALTTARSEEEFFLANETGTRNLAEALIERGERGGFFVYCSSLAAGGPGIATESRPNPVRTERDPDLPVTPYGRSKLAGERALRGIAEEQRFRAVILRPAAVYGPRDSAILQFFRWVKRGILPIGGPEGARLSLLYVTDLIDAARTAAERPVEGTYYLSDGEEHSWEGVGRAAAAMMDASLREMRVPDSLARLVAFLGEAAGRVTGKPPMLTRWKVREMQQAHWVCSPALAGRELGYVPRVDLEAGLEETLAWYREVGWL